MTETTVCQCLGGSTHATPEGRRCDLCGGVVQDQPAPQTTDLADACLRAFHGDGPYGWGLLQQQWPEVAVNEQRRKMAEVIRQVQSASDLATEVWRLSGCLLAIAGAEGCGNGALRTAAYEAATMGATPGGLAAKLKLPTPLMGSAETHG